MRGSISAGSSSAIPFVGAWRDPRGDLRLIWSASNFQCAFVEAFAVFRRDGVAQIEAQCLDPYVLDERRLGYNVERQEFDIAWRRSQSATPPRCSSGPESETRSRILARVFARLTSFFGCEAAASLPHHSWIRTKILRDLPQGTSDSGHKHHDGMAGLGAGLCTGFAVALSEEGPAPKKSRLPISMSAR